MIIEFTNQVKLNKQVNPVAFKIFDFVKRNEYDSLTEIYKMKLDVESIFSNTIKKDKRIISELKEINFFDNRLYSNENQDDIYDLQKTLSNFKFAVIDFYNNGINREPKKLFSTSASPKTGNKVGNNKLEITPTGKDYGLLFE